jgi:hypothetical protein
MNNDPHSVYQLFLFGAIYLFGFVVALAVIAKVIGWLFCVVAAVGNRLTNYLSAVIIGLLQSIFSYGFQLLRLVFGVIFNPVKQVAAKLWVSFLDWLEVRLLYWKYALKEFKGFHFFRQHMNGEEDDREHQKRGNEKEKESANDPSNKETNAYTDALQLLGFSKTEYLDRALLKKRYRELISRVHPDKGCPTPVLAQQINDAVNLVRQKRGWR